MPEIGTANYYTFKEEALNTFSKETADEQESLGHKCLGVETINTSTLAQVFNETVTKNIDLLSIDVEGYDLDVLKTNDWKKFRPSLVVVETVSYDQFSLGKKLNNQYDEYMLSIGYSKIADTYLNTIYIDDVFKKELSS
jgi:hypothetical protein